MNEDRLRKMLTRVVRYSPGGGAGYGQETAKKIGEEFTAMLHEGVVLTPANILARAEDPDSPLHPLFTWDNDQAAKNYRLMEARRIIGRLEIVTADGHREESHKAYFSLSIQAEEEVEPNRQYVRIQDVVADPEKEEQVKSIARQELERWALKYQRFDWPEFQPVISVVLNSK